MKKLIFIFYILILIVSCSSEEDVVFEENNIDLFSNQARVVGYFPYWRFAIKDKIEFCKITHLNIAFANPDSNGNLILNTDTNGPSLADVINTAKSQNVNIKTYISVAGGALSNETKNIWKDFLATGDKRTILIDKIIQFVLNNKLDGVDVDLEWDAVTAGYSNFVLELKQELSVNGKGMTAAFPSETKYSLITDEALNAFDFINIMAYDYTGPWNPSSPGQHSSYNHAQSGLNFWKNNVGVSGHKLTLGVPFYGYDFVNSSNANSFTYGSMVELNNSNSEIDNLGNKYYNGRPTITRKVRLAAQNLSGIMIWELGQDSFTDYSLLKTIHKTYHDLGVKTTGLCTN